MLFTRVMLTLRASGQAPEASGGEGRPHPRFFAAAQNDIFLAAIVGVAALVAAVGCTTPAGGGPSQQTQTATEQPKGGGRLNLLVGFDINNFDIHIASRRVMYYTSIGYNRLLRFKSGPDVGYTDLVLEPELAEKWEVSPDARTVTFHLRKGVKYGNLPPVNGRELTSADVKFSLEYDARSGEFMDTKLPPSPNSYMLQGLERVETPDPYTAVIRFSEPFVPFINYAASSNSLGMLAREIYDADGSFKDRTVGTGPFVMDLQASQPGTRLAWKKNKQYWEPGKPYLDEVYHLVIPDDATARAGFRARQLDALTQGITSQDALELRKDNPNAMALEYSSPEPPFLWVNARAGTPLSDERVRRAISMAIDRQALIDTFAGKHGQWVLAGALPSTFSQEEIKQIARFDLNEAKRLMAEAGHPNGIDVELTYPGNTYGDAYVSLLQLVQAQVKRAGINLTLKNLDVPENSSRTRRGDFQVAAGGTKGLEPDVDSWVYAAFHPKSTNNYGGIDVPELTKLLDAQRQEPDEGKRNQLVRQAVKMINERVLGNLALFYQGEAQFWQPYVKNFHPNFGNPGKTYQANVTSVWLDK